MILNHQLILEIIRILVPITISPFTEMENNIFRETTLKLSMKQSKFDKAEFTREWLSIKLFVDF